MKNRERSIVGINLSIKLESRRVLQIKCRRKKIQLLVCCGVHTASIIDGTTEKIVNYLLDKDQNSSTIRDSPIKLHPTSHKFSRLFQHRAHPTYISHPQKNVQCPLYNLEIAWDPSEKADRRENVIPTLTHTVKNMFFHLSLPLIRLLQFRKNGHPRPPSLFPKSKLAPKEMLLQFYSIVRELLLSNYSSTLPFFYVSALREFEVAAFRAL